MYSYVKSTAGLRIYLFSNPLYSRFKIRLEVKSNFRKVKLEVFHFLTVMLHICIQGEKLKSGTDLATEKFMWTLLDQCINK